MATQLRYRGLAYDKASHEPASSRPVDHVCRGQPSGPELSRRQSTPSALTPSLV